MGLTPSEELHPSGHHHDNDHHDHDDDDDCRQSLTFHHRHFWLVVGEMLTSRSVRRERGGNRGAHIIDVAQLHCCSLFGSCQINKVQRDEGCHLGHNVHHHPHGRSGQLAPAILGNRIRP
jgi:hypothetical protein